MVSGVYEDPFGIQRQIAHIFCCDAQVSLLKTEETMTRITEVLEKGHTVFCTSVRRAFKATAKNDPNALRTYGCSYNPHFQ